MTKSRIYRDLLHLPQMANIDVLNNAVIYADRLIIYAKNGLNPYEYKLLL